MCCCYEAAEAVGKDEPTKKEDGAMPTEEDEAAGAVAKDVPAEKDEAADKGAMMGQPSMRRDHADHGG